MTFDKERISLRRSVLLLSADLLKLQNVNSDLQIHINSNTEKINWIKDELCTRKTEVAQAIGELQNILASIR